VGHGAARAPRDLGAEPPDGGAALRAVAEELAGEPDMLLRLVEQCAQLGVPLAWRGGTGGIEVEVEAEDRGACQARAEQAA
jgi:predicted TIM-barrel fold metal-dependent hydrolase